MTGRSPRLGRLRRVVPEGRTTRPVEARGGKPRRRGTQPKVVALGGGMGLSASLTALRRITGDLTAVVTVADDGGSSGRLRDELGVLPPGTSARRWPRCAATTTGARPGPASSSTASSPRAICTNTRSAIC